MMPTATDYDIYPDRACACSRPLPVRRTDGDRMLLEIGGRTLIATKGDDGWHVRFEGCIDDDVLRALKYVTFEAAGLG